MYRQFYLTNAEGSVWQLTDQSFKAYLNAPQGLGQSETLVTTVYGDVARVNDEEYSFPQVTGEMLFYDDANSDRYQKYNDFARFISYKSLTLHYTIPTNPAETYTLPCYCTVISKGEVGRDGILTCAVTFQGLDFWRGAEVTVIGSTLTSTTLVNDGDYPVGFNIRLAGSMVEPYFTLSQDGEVYGEAKFLDSAAFDTVQVDSQDGQQKVVLTQGGSVVANPIAYQDLSISNGEIYVTFIKLARGVSTLDVGKSSGTLTSVTVTYTPRYRSV